MAEKTLFDISNENFDAFLINNAKDVPEHRKERLPSDISSRLYRAGILNMKFASKLNVIKKLYILWQAMGKRIYIVVEDEEKGISPEQFFEFKKAIKKRDYSIDSAKGLCTEAHFVLGGKELCDTFSYMNGLSNSSAYNYVAKAKNQPKNETTEYRDRMNYIVRFLAFYESNKKRWVAETGITMPEFLVLLYTYPGKEVLGSAMYRVFYKRAYQSSPGKIKTAFGSLQSKGFLKKSGFSRGALLSITPLGRDLMNRILTKYAINC